MTVKREWKYEMVGKASSEDCLVVTVHSGPLPIEHHLQESVRLVSNTVYLIVVV